MRMKKNQFHFQLHELYLACARWNICKQIQSRQNNIVLNMWDLQALCEITKKSKLKMHSSAPRAKKLGNLQTPNMNSPPPKKKKNCFFSNVFSVGFCRKMCNNYEKKFYEKENIIFERSCLDFVLNRRKSDFYNVVLKRSRQSYKRFAFVLRM